MNIHQYLLDIVKLIKDISSNMRFNISIFIVFTFLLFSPDHILKFFDLYNIHQRFHAYLSIIWLLCLAFLIVNIIYWIFDKIKKKRVYNTHIKRLHELTPVEKQYLAPYIAQNTRTQTFEFNDGVVCELETYSIIRRSLSVSLDRGFFPYNIQQWAWEYLKKHPEIVGLNKEI